MTRTISTTTPAENVSTFPEERASSASSSKLTQIITRRWQKFRQQPGPVRACGMRNETGSIWMCPKFERRSRLMGLRARRLGETMKRISKICLVAASFLGANSGIAFSQQGGKQALRLVQTIPLPNVKGRRDHLDVDVRGKHLLVTGLENGTLSGVDLT